jgi:hypothetical protein
MGEQFWQGDLEASWAEAAEGIPEEIRQQVYDDPNGVTVFAEAIDDLVENGYLDADRLYRLRGFKTASGKVEFDSADLRGHRPRRLAGLSRTRREPGIDAGPGARLSAGAHQRCAHQVHDAFTAPVSGAHAPRGARPAGGDPPHDAEVRGIGDGEPVRVSSPRGAVRFIARVTDRVKPGVVHCAHGWS